MTAVDAQRYAVVDGWEQLPAAYVHRDVPGVSVDSQDRVYLITRSDSRVLVYDRTGSFVASWGEDVLTERAHGITVGPDDLVYTVDDGDNTVRQFTPEGQLLLTIGRPGVFSDTGYDGQNVASITQGGPPFNRPTAVAIAPTGELYVADGYGNSRVHRFGADGSFIQSWGEPGTGLGQFHLPHGIWVAADGRVWVTDRENDRIQIFSPDGNYLDQWTDVQRPTAIYMDGAGLIYVSELAWRPGNHSFVHGDMPTRLPGRVSVFEPGGTLVARWGGDEPCAAGNFAAAHDLCVDSRGDLYVAEVTHTFAVARGEAPADCHTLQKFARRV
ncbi:MAG: hypothetical protein CL878_12280 [Dehalococcoidia bacterium]|nr:hypothetical protein [Dehalococcoidia bacterium]